MPLCTAITHFCRVIGQGVDAEPSGTAALAGLAIGFGLWSVAGRHAIYTLAGAKRRILRIRFLWVLASARLALD